MLGLSVKVEEKFEPQVTMTVDELIEVHKQELERLEHLKEMDARGSTSTTVGQAA